MAGKGVLLISHFGMKNFNIWFDRVFSKLNVLIVSVLVSVAPFVLPIPNNLLNECSLSGCGGQYGAFATAVLPTIMVIAIFTAVTYVMKDEVFRFWIRFALLWLIFGGIYVNQIPHDIGALDIDGRPWNVAIVAIVFALLSLLVVSIRMAQVYLITPFFKK